MRLILRAARTTTSSQWVCNSCRGIKHASTLPILSRSKDPPLSPAARKLRAAGPARTRFAPSPTGYLHLGSLRTALFNYMIAKATGGQFLLRVEDTDQKRTVHDAEERVYRDLKWAGIEWDEGPDIGGPYGPYKQSQRIQLYKEHAEQLLHTGKAYRCFCSAEDLNTRAKYRASLGLPSVYDGTCAHIPREESDERASKGHSHVIRLLVPKRYPIFKDLVYGLVEQGKKLTDDPILLKSDGFPTYHLANVVDDHMMNITHVIRGSEWMPSTPKHLALYQAFGWLPPKYAHVGLLMDKDGQKLSKRVESMSMAELRDRDGVFPETLTNFVALLGWSHTRRSDVMNMEDLIQNASFKFTKGDAEVTLEKLLFLQRHHASRYASTQPPKPANPSHDLEELAVKPILNLLERLARDDPDQFLHYASLPEDRRFNLVRAITWADSQNYSSPDKFIFRHVYMFTRPPQSVLEATRPSMELEHVPPQIARLFAHATLLRFFLDLHEIKEQDWNKGELKRCIASIADLGTAKSIGELQGLQIWSEELKHVLKKAWLELVYRYIRWAIMAGMPGPVMAETMGILGRSESIRRLKVAHTILESLDRRQAGAKWKD